MFHEYTRRLLLLTTHFRYTLFKVFKRIATANWLMNLCIYRNDVRGVCNSHYRTNQLNEQNWTVVVYRKRERRGRSTEFWIQISLKDNTMTDVTALDFIAKRLPPTLERTDFRYDAWSGQNERRSSGQLRFSSAPWSSHGFTDVIARTNSQLG